MKPRDMERVTGFEARDQGAGRPKMRHDIRTSGTACLKERLGIDCVAVFGNRGRIVLNAEQLI